MKYIVVFLISFYLGVEVQTWWQKKGAKMFVEWRLRRYKENRQ